jgi:hypothetical protein
MTGDVGGALEAIVVLSYHDGTSHWGLWETALRDIRCSLEKPAFLAGFSHCIKEIREGPRFFEHADTVQHRQSREIPVQT